MEQWILASNCIHNFDLKFNPSFGEHRLELLGNDIAHVSGCFQNTGSIQCAGNKGQACIHVLMGMAYHQVGMSAGSKHFLLCKQSAELGTMTIANLFDRIVRLDP